MEQENSNSRHSKKAEKGIYYELYIKQRDENMKLRKAVHALIKELDESNKRAEVTDFLFKIIYINFVLIFFKSRTNIPLDLQRAPSWKIAIRKQPTGGYIVWELPQWETFFKGTIPLFHSWID